MTTKQVKALLQLMQKHNVSYLKTQDIELSLANQPQAQAQKSTAPIDELHDLLRLTDENG